MGVGLTETPSSVKRSGSLEMIIAASRVPSRDLLPTGDNVFVEAWSQVQPGILRGALARSKSRVLTRSSNSHRPVLHHPQHPRG